MYATHDDLKKRLKRFYDKIYYDVDTKTVDNDLADDDLGEAAAEINGALSVKYAVPVTNATSLPLLKSWELSLAAELAFGRDENAATPENITTGAERVRKQLALVLQGEFGLVAEVAQNEEKSASMIVDVSTPVFGRDNMKGW